MQVSQLEIRQLLNYSPWLALEQDPRNKHTAERREDGINIVSCRDLRLEAAILRICKLLQRNKILMH